MMSEQDGYEVECINCGWEGDVDELVAQTDDPDDMLFDRCPKCDSLDIEDS